jgi:hypothetical protein
MAAVAIYGKVVSLPGTQSGVSLGSQSPIGAE